MTNQRSNMNMKINSHTRLFSYLLYLVLLFISFSFQRQEIQYQQPGQEATNNLNSSGSTRRASAVAAFVIQPQQQQQQQQQQLLHHHQLSSPLRVRYDRHNHNLDSRRILQTDNCSTSTCTKYKRNVFVCHYSNTNNNDDNSNSNSNSNNDEKHKRDKKKNLQNDNDRANRDKKYSGKTDDNDDDFMTMNTKTDAAAVSNNNSTMSPSAPLSSILYDDDECFDLCDVFEDDAGVVSESTSAEELSTSDKGNNGKVDINEMNKNHESIPTTSTASATGKSTTASPPSSSSSSKAKEFNKDPQPTKQVWQNLELRWSIDETSEDCDLEDLSTCSEPCPTCRGTGLVLCQFCGGHGYIDFGFAEEGTMGKRLLGNDNPNGRLGAECPVCNEDGEQGCPTCKGSGWIARWRLGNNNNISDVRP